MKDQHPAVYEEHVKKYKGRERLLRREIPLLNCLWNDVLHISPIHPQLVMDTWRIFIKDQTNFSNADTLLRIY